MEDSMSPATTLTSAWIRTHRSCSSQPRVVHSLQKELRSIQWDHNAQEPALPSPSTGTAVQRLWGNFSCWDPRSSPLLILLWLTSLYGSRVIMGRVCLSLYLPHASETILTFYNYHSDSLTIWLKSFRYHQFHRFKFKSSFLVSTCYLAWKSTTQY